MNPTTDAASGATLSGTSWLSNLIKDGLSGYIAVETIRAQKRQAGSVTTNDIPRVASPAPTESAISPRTLWLAGGVLVATLVLVLLRRK